MFLKKLLFLLAIILLGVFVYFSRLVGKSIFYRLDFDTTVKLQDHISRRWDFPFSILSILGSVEITGLIWLFLLIFTLLKRYWLACLSLFLFFFTIIIELVGKLALYHPGPPYLFYRGVVDFTFPSHYVHTSYSYPSGHMTRAAFLVTFMMGLLYFRGSGLTKAFLQAVLVLLLFLMAISRVYLGEHWSTDVIGGLLLGGAFGCLAVTTIPPLDKRSEDIV